MVSKCVIALALSIAVSVKQWCGVRISFLNNINVVSMLLLQQRHARANALAVWYWLHTVLDNSHQA